MPLPLPLLLAGAIAVISPGEPTNWAANIANIFLAPFGLGSSDSSVSAEGTKGDLLQLTQKRLPQGVPVHVACKDSRCVCVCLCAHSLARAQQCCGLFPQTVRQQLQQLNYDICHPSAADSSLLFNNPSLARGQPKWLLTTPPMCVCVCACVSLLQTLPYHSGVYCHPRA